MKLAGGVVLGLAIAGLSAYALSKSANKDKKNEKNQKPQKSRKKRG